MSNITLQYGMHANSALGFCGLALAYQTVFQDVSEGYRIGKYSLAITNNKNITSVYLTMYGMIGIWKMPMVRINLLHYLFLFPPSIAEPFMYPPEL